MEDSRKVPYRLWNIVLVTNIFMYGCFKLQVCYIITQQMFEAPFRNSLELNCLLSSIICVTLQHRSILLTKNNVDMNLHFPVSIYWKSFHKVGLYQNISPKTGNLFIKKSIRAILGNCQGIIFLIAVELKCIWSYNQLFISDILGLNGKYLINDDWNSWRC